VAQHFPNKWKDVSSSPHVLMLIVCNISWLSGSLAFNLYNQSCSINLFCKIFFKTLGRPGHIQAYFIIVTLCPCKTDAPNKQKVSPHQFWTNLHAYIISSHSNMMMLLLGWMPSFLIVNWYYTQLECGPMPKLMVALPNIGGALCSTPQSLADAHY